MPTWGLASHLPEILRFRLNAFDKKALHAVFGQRRHTDFNKLKPSLACKIFDSMISPILTYNSEVWGAALRNQILSRGTAPQLKKLIYNSVNVI